MLHSMSQNLIRPDVMCPHEMGAGNYAFVASWVRQAGASGPGPAIWTKHVVWLARLAGRCGIARSPDDSETGVVNSGTRGGEASFDPPQAAPGGIKGDKLDQQ